MKPCDATVELTPDKYVVGIWFVSGIIPGAGPGDILLALYKEPDGTYEGRYRFRYYSPASTHPGDEMDRKSFYKMKVAAMPEEEAAEKMGLFANTVGGMVGEVDYIPVFGDGEKAFAALMTKPWAHVDKVTPYPNSG